MMNKHLLKFGRLFVLLTIIMMLVLSAPVTMAQDAQWTIMVYIEGDNNLEGDALADIQEMEFVGSDENVNIVVQIDRAEDYSDGDGDWTDARRFLIQKDTSGLTLEESIEQKFSDPASVRLATTPLEEIGELNNGDPDTLIEFGQWAVENYPAEKYALVLWNHGGTWIGGFGGDESTDDHDSMNLPELDYALDTLTTSMGEKFEFIGFDTCLMGGYEVFSLLSEYANFSAASEELEPGFGWYYTPVIETLINDPSVSGDVLAQSIVTNYMGFYDEVWLDFTGETYSDFFGGDVYGQTAVDLSQMDDLTDALHNFSSVAIANMSSELTAAIADARTNTQMFTLSTPDDAEITGSADLKHFMLLLQRFSSNAEVNDAAQWVIDAVDSMVLLHQATNLDGAHGISIYFPANHKLYESFGLNERYAVEVPHMEEWTQFLEAYYGIAGEVSAASGGRIEVTEQYFNEGEVSTLIPPTFAFEYEGVNLVSLSFSAILKLDDGIEFMIDQSPLTSSEITEDGDELALIEDGLNLSQFTWAADMPVITDGANSVPTVLLSEGQDDSAVVTGDYTFTSSGETISASVIFDFESREAVKYLGINESENGGQPFEITPSNGDTFSPTWRFYDETGELQVVSSEEILMIGAEPLSYSFAPAESGVYDLYFLLEDAAGNVYFDIVEVTVNNDDVDITYRGVNDIALGYSAVIPYEWGDGADIIRDDDSFYTFYVDNDEKFSVIWEFYDAFELSDMEDSVQEYIDTYIAEVSEPFDLIFDLDELEAVGYDYYSSNDDGQEFYGVIAYTVYPDTGIGYLIDYTIATSEPTDDDYTYFFDLLANTFFFEPIQEPEAEDMLDDSASDERTIESVLIESGWTVEEFNDLFEDGELTVADVQAEVDAGLYSVDEFITDFFEEE